MNDSFLLGLPRILGKDIIFLSLRCANNILKDSGRGTNGGGRRLCGQPRGCWREKGRVVGRAAAELPEFMRNRERTCPQTPRRRDDRDSVEGTRDQEEAETGVIKHAHCPLPRRGGHKGINLAANIKCVQ